MWVPESVAILNFIAVESAHFLRVLVITFFGSLGLVIFAVAAMVFMTIMTVSALFVAIAERI